MSEDRPKDPRPTVRFDPSDLRPSWPVAVALLEQVADWSTFALRLGVLALVQECVRELAQREAPADRVTRLRELVEVLAQLPYET